MIPDQIAQSVLALPESDRLALARRIVESIAIEEPAAESISEGVRRIEEIATGKIRGLSEDEYRRMIG